MKGNSHFYKMIDEAILNGENTRNPGLCFSSAFRKIAWNESISQKKPTRNGSTDIIKNTVEIRHRRAWRCPYN